MNVLTFYCGISLLVSFVVLFLLLITDVTFIVDRILISHMINLFVVTEFFKYFMISQVPDVDRILGISAAHSHPGQRIPSERKLKKVLKGAFLMLVVTTLYHVVIVLLGASVLHNFEETLMLSVVLAILSFLPLCLYLGPNLALGVLFNNPPAHVGKFEAMLRQSLYVTIFGAWLGAFVIPLDWDRPWQKWPIPCLLGAVSGFCISHTVSVVRALFPVVKNVSV